MTMKKEDMEEVDLKLNLINAILAARPLTVAMGFSSRPPTPVWVWV
jgi:hypothetical protein